MLQNEKLMIFMHIPKTGGTTLRRIFDQQYPYDQTLTFENLEQFESKLSEVDLNKIKCILGHIDFGTLHKYFTKPSSFVTMLRDPIDRIISEYYYLLRSSKHPEHYKVKNISFEEFICMKEFQGRTVNSQTRYLTGFNELPNVQKAMANIKNHFSVVGVTENFSESLFLIKKEFNWQNILYRKHNITKDRPAKTQFSKEIIDYLKEKNEMDVQLYNYAQKHLMEKIQSLDSNSKKDLNNFVKKINN